MIVYKSLANIRYCVRRIGCLVQLITQKKNKQTLEWETTATVELTKSDIIAAYTISIAKT